jgi:hypothetical protein
MADRKRAGRHLGIALDDEIAGQLADLVRLEQERIGGIATVSASALVLHLIREEHVRKFPPKKGRGQ